MRWTGVQAQQLDQIEAALTRRMIEVFGLDTHALILDMTNFATFIDSSNDRAPIAARGKAKQKRYDLRLVRLAWPRPATAASHCCLGSTRATRPMSPSSPLGALIGGVVADWTSVATAFLVSGLAQLAVVVLFYRLINRHQQLIVDFFQA